MQENQRNDVKERLFEQYEPCGVVHVFGKAVSSERHVLDQRDRPLVLLNLPVVASDEVQLRLIWPSFVGNLDKTYPLTAGWALDLTAVLRLDEIDDADGAESMAAGVDHFPIAHFFHADWAFRFFALFCDNF